MKNATKLGIIVLILGHLLLAVWILLHGDIRFHTDIARDFLLLNELGTKGLVLIGPRASILGLFHGPLWTYLNFPAYLIGHGNPLVVGWFWVLLWMVFLVTSIKIAARIFGEKSAYIFGVLLSLFMVRHIIETFHPYGALMLSPVFFYTFVRYWETSKMKYLLLHILMGGLLIQFQMATGIPFMILTAVFILVLITKNKKYWHLLAYVVLLIPLSSFILFDLRHNFLQLRSIEMFLTKPSGGNTSSLMGLLVNRWDFMISNGIYLFYGFDIMNRLVFGVVMILIGLQIKNNVKRKVYIAFLYIFGGYFLLSVANKGIILHPQFFALAPLVFLIFSSLVTSKYREIFLMLFGGVYLFNLFSGIQYVQKYMDFSGKEETSWKFQGEMAKSIYADSKSDFGYFVYSPDIYAYGPRYAMIYTNNLFNNRGESFKKKAITYLIYSNIPSEVSYYSWTADNRRWGTPTYWRTNKVRITNNNKTYSKDFEFPNGYRWEKYELTAEEEKIPTDQDFDMGLTFR